MVLFTVLFIIALILLMLGIAALAVGGTAFIVVFGDIIICVLLIVWLIKKLFFKKR